MFIVCCMETKVHSYTRQAGEDDGENTQERSGKQGDVGKQKGGWGMG